MDSFESIVATLLRREGYWTATSFKVELTKADKQAISLPSSPRWELDLLAYKAATNETLAVECKSFLHSTGVVFRNGRFEPERRYKLFANAELREVVLKRLECQLEAAGLVRRKPKVTLCLAAGHIARKTDRPALERHFETQGWRLFDAGWVCKQLTDAAGGGYENDIAHVVAKLMVQARLEAGEDNRAIDVNDDMRTEPGAD